MVMPIGVIRMKLQQYILKNKHTRVDDIYIYMYIYIYIYIYTLLIMENIPGLMMISSISI